MGGFIWSTQERVPWAPKYEERTRNEIFRQERCARKAAQILAQDVYKLKEGSQETFTFLPKFGYCQHLLRQIQKSDNSSSTFELQCTVKKEGLEFRRVGESQEIQIPITVVTANGEVQTKEEAQVYVHDLHVFATVQLLEDIDAVLSLGKLCQEHGCTFECPSGREPGLSLNGNQTLCRTDNVVPSVVPGLSSSSTPASSSTSPPQELSVSMDPANTRINEGATGNFSEGVAGNCNRDVVPEWSEDFRKPRDRRSTCTR